MSVNRTSMTAKTIAASLGLVLIGMVAVALAQPAGEGGSPGPPPEAIAACTGKSEGDTVQFRTRRGDTLAGTCRRTRDGRLAAMPEGGLREHRPGLPPEASRACEGKKPGDTVQIRTPKGATVTATCRLIAAPQN